MTDARYCWAGHAIWRSTPLRFKSKGAAAAVADVQTGSLAPHRSRLPLEIGLRLRLDALGNDGHRQVSARPTMAFTIAVVFSPCPR